MPSLDPLGLSGAGGLGACPIASLLECLPFPTARLLAGCAFGVDSWLMPLAPPSPWIPSFGFRVVVSSGLALGRCGAVRGGAAQKLGAVCLGLSLVFFVKERVK